MWAVLCKGTAAARTGIRSDNLIGDRWVEIIPPGDNLRIVQVSVGTNAVWCVTNDNHVWFRRGIKGGISGISEEAAIGNCWIEMVGNIAQVSVAPNDQVFAIGSENDKYVEILPFVSILLSHSTNPILITDFVCQQTSVHAMGCDRQRFNWQKMDKNPVSVSVF